MEKEPILAYVLVSLLLLSVAATSTKFVGASTTEEEEAATPELPFSTPPPETPEAPASSTTTTLTPNATAAATNASADYVRARVQLFGIPPNSPDIITWITVPAENASGAASINYTELENSNNVTDDGMGEMFMALPNVTSALNQQIEACATDVVSQVVKCDNAFTSNATQSTVLQILLGEPSAQAKAATP